MDSKINNCHRSLSLGPSTCHPNKPSFSNNLCRSCYEKQLRIKNPEFRKRQLKNREEWYQKNKDRFHDYQRRRLENPILRLRDKKTKRINHLKKYGLSEKLLSDLIEFQNNKCAICKRSFIEIKRWHIDHDYETNKIRGVLCSRCNNGLGMFDDCIEGLENAINYLKKCPVDEFLIKNGHNEKKF